jgi:NADH-quinone oxidoreductase subunit J
VADVFLFWFLAVLTVGCGLAVVLFPNPVHSALSLVMAMVGITGLFILLGAYFIAGVQLIVYAGAVMVLFVMVLMLFDLKEEEHTFSKGQVSGAFKLAAVGMLAGLIIGALALGSSQVADANLEEASQLSTDGSRALGHVLFTKHVFSFEALGVLLLVVAVGAVALARSKGGTHAKH